MIKCLILFLIFAGISTKESISSGIQFDVDVPFDKQNNEFSFDYTEDNAYFFIMIETGDILEYEVICTSQDTISGDVVGSVDANFFIKALNAGSCNIKFIQNSSALKMSGTFFVHPMKYEIQVSLGNNNKYSIGYLVSTEDENCPQLTFSISNPTQNYDIDLSYGNCKVDGVVLSNPYKVCQENDCKENIKSYSIEKGKNYKIFIKFEKVGNKYYFPNFAFSFHLIPQIEFDEGVPFNEQNNHFNFEYTEDNTFFLIEIETNYNLNYEITCTSQDGMAGELDGYGDFSFIIKAQHAGKCGIKFIQNSSALKMSGTFAVHLMKNEIQVNFEKIKKFTIGNSITIEDENCPQLTFSISNPTQNYDIDLSYDNCNVDGVVLSNPFKVCQENDCKENINSYSIEKGKNYKIIIKFEKVGNKYAFPSFEFSVHSNLPNSAFNIQLSIISLILLLLF